MPKIIVCVACRPHSDETVAEQIRLRCGAEAIAPTWVKEVKSGGQYSEKVMQLMPGYVFAYFDDMETMRSIRRLDHVIRILKYEDGSFDLLGSDRAFAEWIYGHDGQIGVSRALKVGDTMQIVDGPLKDYEGVVRRVNKHDRYADLEIKFQGRIWKVSVSFQWVVFKDGEYIRFNGRQLITQDGGE